MPRRTKPGTKEGADRVAEAASGHGAEPWTQGADLGMERPDLGVDPGNPDEKKVRKNFWLYQSKIDLAKEVLGVETDTAAVDRALDLLIYGERLARGTQAMYGEAYNDWLGIADEIPERE